MWSTNMTTNLNSWRVLLLGVLVLVACGPTTTPKEPFILGEAFVTETPMPHDPAKLIPLVTSANPAVQMAAIHTLESLGSQAAAGVPALLQVLASDDAQIQAAAMRCLGAIGSAAQPAIPHLLAFLDDSNEGFLQSAALGALGSMGDVSVVPRLIPVLYGSRPFVAVEAAVALRTLTGIDFNAQYGWSFPETDFDRRVYAARAWWEHEGRQQQWGQR
jgi:HEAT repeat protein